MSFCLCKVLEKMREQIKSRGAKTIRGLGRVFRNFDSFDGNHKVDAQEFFSGLKEIQVDVTESEAKVRLHFAASAVASHYSNLTMSVLS